MLAAAPSVQAVLKISLYGGSLQTGLTVCIASIFCSNNNVNDKCLLHGEKALRGMRAP